MNVHCYYWDKLISNLNMYLKHMYIVHMFQIQVFLNTMCLDLYYVYCIFSIFQEVLNIPVGREASPHCQDWNYGGKDGTSATLTPGGWTVSNQSMDHHSGGCKDY